MGKNNPMFGKNLTNEQKEKQIATLQKIILVLKMLLV
jgi:hypothetical protein